MSRPLPKVGVGKFIDQSTGQPFEAFVVSSEDRAGRTDDGFVKLWVRPFLAALNAFSIKRVDVFAYLVKQAEFNPIITKTIDEIAKDVGCSNGTVCEVLRLMERHDIIRRKGRYGVIHFNEDIIFRGSSNRRMVLLAAYRGLPLRDEGDDRESVIGNSEYEHGKEEEECEEQGY